MPRKIPGPMILPAVIMLMLLSCRFSSPSIPGQTTRGNSTASAGSRLSGSGDYDYSVPFDGKQRTYKVHVPPGYEPNVPMPLVIFLHGGGGSNQSMVTEGLDKASDSYRFILVAPNGTGLLENKLLTWNAGAWSGGTCCGYAVNNNMNDVGFISSLIDDLKGRFNIDEKRVYATGISNGGMMAYRLACELSSKIAAVAPVAPPAVPQGCAPGRPVSILHMHGTADPCAPYYGGTGGGCLLGISSTFTGMSAQEMVDFWLHQDAIQSAPTIIYQHGAATCTSYSNGNSEVEFCSIEGGGHTWPDGSQYAPVALVGPVSHDISFQQIWEFFARHTLP